MRSSAVQLTVRSGLRRRRAGLLTVALLVAVGVGGSLGALAAAHRTDHVYREYVHDADVTDLVINPSLASDAIDREIRHLPGVKAVHTDWLMTASIGMTEPAPISELTADEDLAMQQIRGSADGRYEEVDRPVVTEGRLPTGTREVFVSQEYRPELERILGRNLALGDTLDTAFWWGALTDGDVDPATVATPIGVEELTLVGFGLLPDEVLPDELYARQRVLVSGDVIGRYVCSFDLESVDATLLESTSDLLPEDCSSTYRYYSLDLDDGVSESDIKASFAQAVDRIEDQIPPAVAEAGIGYFYISQNRADLDHAVDSTTRPTVAALTVFGLVAGLATVTVAVLAVARAMRREQAELRSLRAIGATRMQLAQVLTVPWTAAALAGLAAAVPVGFLVSTVGPSGSVRALVPGLSPSMPMSVIVPVLTVAGVVLVLSIGAAAWMTAVTAVRARPRPARRQWSGVIASRIPSPALSRGVASALSGGSLGGALLTLAGCAVGVAALVAAIVFGTNLRSMVDRPAQYGWPWDVAVITGAGYGDTDSAAVAEQLDQMDDVDSYGFFALDPAVTLGGTRVAAMLQLAGTDPPQLPLAAGRPAQRPGEAVLGAQTARDIGAEVGDELAFTSYVPTDATITVVGIATMPTTGSFIADRTGLGTGALVVIDPSPEALEQASPIALTGVRLVPGTSPDDFIDGLDPGVQAWDVYGAPPNVHTNPVRPAEIVNADAMSDVPLMLGGVLAVALVLGLGLSIAVSVRDRRRELAILRAIGFTRAGLRTTVTSQAVCSVLIGLIIGLPLGLRLGDYAWNTFATELGLVPRADVPVPQLALVVAGALVLAVLAALPSARVAARIQTRNVLDVRSATR